MFGLCDSGYSSPICYSSPTSSAVFYDQVEDVDTKLSESCIHQHCSSRNRVSRRSLFKASPLCTTETTEAATQTGSESEDLPRIIARRLRQLANDFESRYFISQDSSSRNTPLKTFIDLLLQ